MSNPNLPEAPILKRDDRVIGIFGKRGSGKSVWLSEFIWTQPRVLVYDVNADFNDLPEKPDIVSLALAVRDEDSFHYRYVPTEPEKDIEQFSRMCFLRGDVCVIFDEVHLTAPLHSINPKMAELFRRGRHRGIKIAFATQRPAAVNKMLTSQMNQVIMFKMVDNRDLLAAQQFLDIDSSVLKRLKPGERIEREF